MVHANDVLEIIKSRRTIEEFLPKYVDWDKISKILDAARHAPSTGNIQNWKFIVIDDSSQKQALAAAAYDQYKITMASHLIVVVAQIEKAQRYYGLRGVRLYSIQNCAAAIENMLIMAQALGLGTKWIGAFDEDKVRAVCGIPAAVRPQAIIAVGYAKVQPPKPPKYPLEPQAYLGKWRNRIRDANRYMGTYSAILKKNLTAIKDTAAAASKMAEEKFAPNLKKQSMQKKDTIQKAGTKGILSITDKIRAKLKKQLGQEEESKPRPKKDNIEDEEF
ncbi:hypothetical protein HOB06_04325 [archaeon]|jgi:nitroreductase|nr:hypothetical protein [archaeon]